MARATSIAVGKTGRVTESLRGLSGIASVDTVTGPYDISAVASVGDLNAEGDLVTGSVHTIDGIYHTVTCLALGGDS